MYNFIKVCEYLENLTSVQTLLLFDYTGSALKGDRKIVPRKIAPRRLPQKIPPCARFRVWVSFRVGGNLPEANFPSTALKNTDK